MTDCTYLTCTYIFFPFAENGLGKTSIKTNDWEWEKGSAENDNEKELPSAERTVDKKQNDFVDDDFEWDSR